MSDMIVGIDLGTTNSEVAFVRDGKPVVLEEDGDPILPSFVGLSEDGRLLVGKAARNQWVLAPERTIKSIKRKMGQDVKVKLGDQEYRPQEISAMILRALRDLPEEFRVAVYLADIEGYSYKEIAKIMGTPIGTVMSRLHRGRGRLRDKLAPYRPGHGLAF